MDDSNTPKVIKPTKNRGGRWVVIGGEQYLVPALAFRAVIDLQDKVETLREIQGRPTPEQMSVVEEIVHSALKRNYPDITQDDVGDMIDLGNWQHLLGAVLSIGGFEKREAADASGEPVASTGTSSTSA